MAGNRRNSAASCRHFVKRFRLHKNPIKSLI
nr:MAG TPA: hypothetical protein [Caudoviricetes sp.]